MMEREGNPTTNTRAGLILMGQCNLHALSYPSTMTKAIACTD